MLPIELLVNSQIAQSSWSHEWCRPMAEKIIAKTITQSKVAPVTALKLNFFTPNLLFSYNI